jgi:hypothetical protein
VIALDKKERKVQQHDNTISHFIESVSTMTGPKSKKVLLVYDVPEAGAMLGLTRNGSYEAAKRGDIPTIRIGGLIKVPKVAFHRMLERVDREFVGRNGGEREYGPEIDRGWSSRSRPARGKAESQEASLAAGWQAGDRLIP